MASVGADVEQLRALAQLFGDKATSLEDGVSSINGQLHSAGWVGEDADTFKADWDSNRVKVKRDATQTMRAWLRRPMKKVTLSLMVGARLMLMS